MDRSVDPSTCRLVDASTLQRVDELIRRLVEVSMRRLVDASTPRRVNADSTLPLVVVIQCVVRPQMVSDKKLRGYGDMDRLTDCHCNAKGGIMAEGG